MSTLAAIVQEYGTAYEEAFSEKLLPSHQRTMRDIAVCRTVDLGGHVYYCDHCQTTHYQYHSCRNRHCPQCQHQQGQAWLERQTMALLPVPYFMVTFTIPAALHQVTRLHQRTLYNILFRASAKALQELAGDPRYAGGQIGMIGVLHTWGRQLNYHPHVHYLVPAGSLSYDGRRWVSSRRTFLVPVKALSILFRAKFRDALKKTEWFDEVPSDVWQQDWVTHCQPVGKGEAALRYLAPYIFRVAISNTRILKVAAGQVTFRYRPSGSNAWKRCTLSVFEFLRRFLQHVLPKGFVKVRYYGFFSHSAQHLIPWIRSLLDADTVFSDSDDPIEQVHAPTLSRGEVYCPICQRVMRCIQHLSPRSRGSPSAA
jgi:hypothetical protein